VPVTTDATDYVPVVTWCRGAPSLRERPLAPPAASRAPSPGTARLRARADALPVAPSSPGSSATGPGPLDATEGRDGRRRSGRRPPSSSGIAAIAGPAAWSATTPTCSRASGCDVPGAAAPVEPVDSAFYAERRRVRAERYTAPTPAPPAPTSSTARCAGRHPRRSRATSFGIAFRPVAEDAEAWHAGGGRPTTSGRASAPLGGASGSNMHPRDGQVPPLRPVRPG
jgi:hypothetical protein